MYIYITLYILGFVIIGLALVRSTLQLQITAASIVISSIVLYQLFSFDFKSTQILSGKIISKYKDTVSCEHSYNCNCDDDGFCSTCYEHSNDYDWVLKTNIRGKNILIDRVDRIGKKEPERFTKAVIGESVFIEDKYMDYFKMSNQSVIHSKSSIIKDINISYPKVFDYYKLNRVIYDGGKLNINNEMIGDILSSINPSKEVNIIFIVIGMEKDINDYLISVREKFSGGRKNDVFVIIQSDENIINRSRVFSRSSNKMFDEKLEYFINKIGEFDNDVLLGGLKDIVTKEYIREDYEQYSFLKNDLKLSKKYYFIYLIFILMTSTILIYQNKR